MADTSRTNINTFGDTFTQTYNASSGCDIVATLDGVVLGNLNGISFSTTREKAPIYVMGSVDAVAFGRGKRGHAGSLIFTNFDRHAMYDVMNREAFGDTAGAARYKYWKKTTDIPAGGRSKLLSADFADLSRLGVELATPNYSDQIPPFTITLTATNEYGNVSVMSILGVELINEGSGISIDDIVTETQMTFVARAILGWRPLGSASKNAVNGRFSVDNDDVVERINNLTAVQQANDALNIRDNVLQ